MMEDKIIKLESEINNLLGRALRHKKKPKIKNKASRWRLIYLILFLLIVFMVVYSFLKISHYKIENISKSVYQVSICENKKKIIIYYEIRRNYNVNSYKTLNNIQYIFLMHDLRERGKCTK